MEIGFKLLITKIIDEIFISHVTNLFQHLPEKVSYVLWSPLVSEAKQKPTVSFIYIFI